MSSNVSISSSWDTIKIVGKGGSSVVYKARFTDTGQIIAVKQIDTEGLTKEQINGLKGEIDTIKELHHPNIISYYGTQKTLNKINIFLEYADRGSLRQFYHKKGPLKEHQVINVTRQILNGLNYLHDKGIAHRDIKCANCLLTQKGVVKLADFGASKRFESESLVSGLKGTPNWMAPEVIKGVTMTAGWMKADVWSLGCTIVEMLSADMPFSEYDNPMTAMYHIANGKPPSVLSIQCSHEIKGFIALCCASDPTTRPSVEYLLSHPFLQKLPKSGHASPVKSKNENTLIQDIYDHNSLPDYPRIQPNIVPVSISHERDEDEVVDECEIENEYTQELFDDEESIEDESNFQEFHGNLSAYDMINSQSSILDRNKKSSSDPAQYSQIYTKQTSDPYSSASSVPSNYFHEQNSDISSSRKCFPRPARKSSDEIFLPTKTNSPKIPDPNRIHYSLSAPASRVTTANATSLETSPRAASRRALAAAVDEKNRFSTSFEEMNENRVFFQVTEDRPTAPLSGELHRIQNKLQEAVTLNSDSFMDISNGKKVSLPRSIPKEVSKSNNGVLNGSSKKNSYTIDSSNSQNSTKKSMNTQTSSSRDILSKPRRRVALKERSKSAGVGSDVLCQSDLDVLGRSSLPPVLIGSSSARNLSNHDRHIQSAPPVVRGISLPSVPSPGKSDSS